MTNLNSTPNPSNRQSPAGPCLERGTFDRVLHCAPTFYSVGKISKNGWRECFGVAMPNTRDEYLQAKPVATRIGEFSYAGPFFIRCDHGCSHGNKSHATASICEANGFRPAQVFRQSELQIREAGFVLAWIGVGDDGFESAYGSLVEIGIARSLGKPILFAHHPEANLRDFWFALEAATAVVRTEDPLAALVMLTAEGARR